MLGHRSWVEFTLRHLSRSCCANQKLGLWEQKVWENYLYLSIGAFVVFFEYVNRTVLAILRLGSRFWTVAEVTLNKIFLLESDTQVRMWVSSPSSLVRGS